MSDTVPQGVPGDGVSGVSTAVIRAHGLCHAFGVGETRLQALRHIELTIARGEVVMLMGPSGSGKTTLLTLIGCLRAVQTGSAVLLGQELRGASDAVLRHMRRRLGFIFQAHHLHSSLTAMQNVRLGLEVHGAQPMQRWQAACERVLDLVGLADRRHHLPTALSGGQQQRVAVARALVGNPDIILADEPTAALDAQTGYQTIAILRRLADIRGTTSVIVTHDHRILDLADRIVRLEDGCIVDQTK